MYLIQQTAVTARGDTEELPSAYLCLRADTPAATRQHPHAAKTTRNPAAAFGDCWPRLVLEHRVIGGGIHGQTWWQSPSSGAARSLARSLWPSPATMRYRGPCATEHGTGPNLPVRRAWTRWPTDPKKGTFGVLRGSLPH
jgi:hypothetical protein